MGWRAILCGLVPLCLVVELAAGLTGCAGAAGGAGSAADTATASSAGDRGDGDGADLGAPGREAAGAPAPADGRGEMREDSEGGDEDVGAISLDIDGVRFQVTLEDNEAARELASRMPMTADMSELNGNEKYCYLEESLPGAPERPGTIHAGDIMLYGSDCLVLFYETFSSGYSYTRIGRIDGPSGLAEAVGSGSVSIGWEMAG